MLRLPFVLALAAVAAPGCATSAAASSPGLDLSRIDLAAPVPAAPLPAASAWSEWQPLAAVTPLPRAAPGIGGVWISHVSLLGGGRWLDKDDWSPLEHQQVFGLEIDESLAASGNGYEAGVLYAHDEDQLESTTYEVYGGYRYTFGVDSQPLHPFVSLGLSAMQGKLENSVSGVSQSDRDSVLGAYARAGLLWDFSDRIRLGLDYRRFLAGDLDFELFGTSHHANADYDQLMLSLGWEF